MCYFIAVMYMYKTHFIRFKYGQMTIKQIQPTVWWTILCINSLDNSLILFNLVNFFNWSVLTIGLEWEIKHGEFQTKSTFYKGKCFLPECCKFVFNNWSLSLLFPINIMIITCIIIFHWNKLSCDFIKLVKIIWIWIWIAIRIVFHVFHLITSTPVISSKYLVTN